MLPDIDQFRREVKRAVLGFNENFIKSSLNPPNHLTLKNWSGYPDLNRGPHRPERCALTGLRHTPMKIYLKL